MTFYIFGVMGTREYNYTGGMEDSLSNSKIYVRLMYTQF